LGLHYAIPWPNRELATARPFRRSPVHHLLYVPAEFAIGVYRDLIAGGAR
jgi:hypothetical protein